MFGRLLVLFVAAAGLISCDSQKHPAELAFAQVQSSVGPVSAELEKYAPDEYAQLTAQIDVMKSKLNTKDYAGAVAQRAAIMSQLAAVASTAAQHKNALMRDLAGDWRQLAAAVPETLGKLAAGLGRVQNTAKSAAGLQQAKQTLAELNDQWLAATNAMKGRDIETAISKARVIQKKAAEMAEAWNLN